MPEYQIIIKCFHDTLRGRQQRASHTSRVGSKIEAPRASSAEKKVTTANQNEKSAVASLRESTDIPR